MARPRVFVSSTYYDLKHVRASLENFIERIGYEPILSEKGDIAYSPHIALDESCYREVGSADIFVLIIGGRYGSHRSDDRRETPPSFFDRYESITKSEYRTASSRDIPIYIFIESTVHAEYQTFLRNKTNTTIEYAHVDSINVFHLIEEILNQPRNNPIKQFERAEDIEPWLRDQWAGLFKEFLNRTSSQKQIASLGAQVTELAEINQTMRRYLEEVVSKVSPATNLVAEESERLERAARLARFEANRFINHLTKFDEYPLPVAKKALESADSFTGFLDALEREKPVPTGTRDLILEHPAARDDINDARELLNLSRFSLDEPSPTRERTRRMPIPSPKRQPDGGENVPE